MMEKERTTRRSLLRALYLLPLVCISLALNAKTKVNYVYDDAQSDQTPRKIVGRVTYESDTVKYEGAVNDELIKSLPGVEFDQDGNMTVNGKAVRKILVNGKEYYSDAQSPIFANDIVDEVEGKAPEGYSRKVTVNVDKNTDQVTITSEVKPDSKWNATAYRIPDAETFKGIVHLDEENGEMTVNGKKVSRVLVNGKEVPLNEADSITRALFKQAIGE